MKIREYLLHEVANTIAYWISPKGEVVPVGSNHIDVIIKNPSKFGLTSDYINNLYDKYNEKMGQEGRAREEIILDVVKKGWIRVRRYRNEGYSINVDRISKKVKDIIFDWVDKLTTTGILGIKEKDLFTQLSIIGFKDNLSRMMTIKDVQKGLLYEGLEEFDGENSIIICESIKEVK